MFGLSFRFPVGRYHATPWGRNVNEADVAWPPEPWRILRALIACYWRKCDRQHWSEEDLARLIESLAADMPVFCLPEGSVHAHTRHFMPVRDGKAESKRLVFDAFLHFPDGADIQVIWQDVTLDSDLLALAHNLASGIGYLGRAESWTECCVVTEPSREVNCGPAELGYFGEELCRLLVARTPESYAAERERLIDQEKCRIRASANGHVSARELQRKVEKSFRSAAGVDTLPARLVDAIAMDNADLQNRKWDRPPAAYETIYARSRSTSPSVVSRASGRSRPSVVGLDEPSVARYILAGRPRPRIEDAVKIGEVMRAAAMFQFGWEESRRNGKRRPLAPWQISGRDENNRPLRDPTHPHAFWLPEDADDDGWIDHIIVYISGGMSKAIRSRLDRITRIWLASHRAKRSRGGNQIVDEWRLALEGFGQPEDFAGSSRLLEKSKRWRSVTPFLSAGHIKKSGYPGEVVRLLKRRGLQAEGVTIMELNEIVVGSTSRHSLHFHRFRSRGQEPQRDSSGALLEIEFPRAIRGPLAMGYACHFGLGVFEAT